ncbi:MAG: hypothetical protein KKA10_09690 [Euryarchaeota archaeon]|nr:hypothetical protein [Euryarchaeota archaeon]MCG2737696.1 hypothetical protein [Candidatus Methanoperedenaceae archaeon]
MIQAIKDIALRIGLGLIFGMLLLMFTAMLKTIFYQKSKQINLIIVFILIALIAYALGDIALDLLHF